MKIRIQDNSIRFRLTLKEVEELGRTGALTSQSRVLSPTGPAGVFHYGIECLTGAEESEVIVGISSIVLRLSEADRASLMQPDEEGVYLRREWTAPNGTIHRFMAFIEKDRPGSTCVKKEQWIYDAPPHGDVETRPIPQNPKTNQP